MSGTLLPWALQFEAAREQPLEKEFSAEKFSLSTEHKDVLEKKLLESRQLLEKLSE